MNQSILCMTETIDLAKAYRALHFAIKDLKKNRAGNLSIQLNPGVFCGTNLMIRNGTERGGSIPADIVIQSFESWKGHIETVLVERGVDLESLTQNTHHKYEGGF